MEKRVVIGPLQKVPSEDLNEMGLFPQRSIDHVVKELLIPDLAFVGFPVTITSTSKVTVGEGRVIGPTGAIYFNDTPGGEVVDLINQLPAVGQRIIALTVWGVIEESKTEPRTFLQDAEQDVTVSTDVSTEVWRWANVGTVAGPAGPDPQRPAVPINVIVIAWVRVAPTGIVSVERNDDGVAPNLREADTRLNENDAWRLRAGSLLDTLRSDLATLAGRIKGLAPWEFLSRVTGDVARLKEQFSLPAVYTAYAADHFLTLAQSAAPGRDVQGYPVDAHADWLAHVEEGVRFPQAAVSDSQLGLLNPIDTSVMINGNVMLPAWDPSVRISNVGAHVEVAMSQFVHQTVDMVRKTMGRMVVRYGSSFDVCTNSQFWHEGTYDFAAGTFRRGAEVFEVQDSLIDVMTIGDWALRQSHGIIRMRKVWQDTVEEPYWERVVITGAVTGSIGAQTFLNAQDGWLTSVDIYFSRVGTVGDVQLLITETVNGAPDLQRVIAQTTKAVADLKLSPGGTPADMVPTNFGLQPTFLQKGNRYAIVLVTAGAHYAWQLKDTNNVQGTWFFITDGAFAQGDHTLDLAFRCQFAHFKANRVEVQLQPVSLAGGITNININADSIVPGGIQSQGVSLHFEVQRAGVWYRMDTASGPDTAFIGLPPLMPFKAVFNGTADIHAALGVASNSRVLAWRPQTVMRHISTVRVMPSAVDYVDVEVRLEAWRGDPYHTFLLRLLHGAGFTTVKTAAAVSDRPAPDDPTGAIYRKYTFDFVAGGGVTQYRIRMDGTTDNQLTCYHVAERIDIGHD